MEVIETETLLDRMDALLGSGTTILVPDDPDLVGLGSSIAEANGMERSSVAVIPKDHLFDMLKRISDRGSDAALIAWSADVEERLLEKSWDIVIVGRLDYHDPSSLFGRPTLCLLSKRGVTWGSIPDEPIVMIDRRYENICRSYVREMWKKATVRLPPPGICPGCAGGSDLVITMVDGEEIIDRTDLYPIDLVAKSDPVLVRIAA